MDGGEKTVELLLTKAREHKAKAAVPYRLSFTGTRWTNAA
jgi:hypothetical protein